MDRAEMLRRYTELDRRIMLAEYQSFQHPKPDDIEERDRLERLLIEGDEAENDEGE